MKGQIIKILSNTYTVKLSDGVIECKCRGRIKYERIIPLVGDYVIVDKEKKVIDEILPRKNSFNRPAVANIDQAILVTSLKTPDFSLNLLDKLIVLMELHNVVPLICITKRDLITDDEFKDIKKHLDYYKSIGYVVIFNTEINEIKKLIANKTTVFTGQTGAGKSTLLNKLNNNLNLETGEVSIALGRGRHTTRVVELIELDEGNVLDTPGFSALDFMDYTKEEIRDAFIEFTNYPCMYKDCMHTNEEECNVKKAVIDYNISRDRYENYLKFIEGK